jgi:hypothetical protein
VTKVTVATDRRGRLSQGVLLEGSIVARLLGLRLLTLEATVVLAPADVTTGSIGQRDAARRPASASLPRRAPVPGRELAAAVRNLDEGARLLEQARHSGT